MCIKYETMLNSCLIQRICEEERFEPLSKMEGILMKKTDKLFEAAFDKTRIQRLLHESEQL